MSLVLGKIHYWLYNKILWFERAEEDMANWAKQQGLPVEKWQEEMYARYGEPTGGKALEDIIDTSNIHGWLQGRIERAEGRHAMLITKILDRDDNYKTQLITLFAQQGVKAGTDYKGNRSTPEGVYNGLNDFILEGMPCDMVNQTVATDDNQFAWRAVRCLHKPYWDQVQGNVQHFYDLREAWIQAFVDTVNSEFKYSKLPDGTQKIVRK